MSMCHRSSTQHWCATTMRIRPGTCNAWPDWSQCSCITAPVAPHVAETTRSIMVLNHCCTKFGGHEVRRLSFIGATICCRNIQCLWIICDVAVIPLLLPAHLLQNPAHWQLCYFCISIPLAVMTLLHLHNSHGSSTLQ